MTQKALGIRSGRGAKVRILSGKWMAANLEWEVGGCES